MNKKIYTVQMDADEAAALWIILNIGLSTNNLILHQSKHPEVDVIKVAKIVKTFTQKLFLPLSEKSDAE